MCVRRYAAIRKQKTSASATSAPVVSYSIGDEYNTRKPTLLKRSSGSQLPSAAAWKIVPGTTAQHVGLGVSGVTIQRIAWCGATLNFSRPKTCQVLFLMFF
jgi:hypothetical protein